MHIQFKKGVLELCVLSQLVKGDRYGYELASDLARTIAIADGTLYPVLRRLKSDGYVSTYLEESSGGPPRKYYRLTPAGDGFRRELHAEWYTFVTGVNRIIIEAGGKSDDKK